MKTLILAHIAELCVIQTLGPDPGGLLDPSPRGTVPVT